VQEWYNAHIRKVSNVTIKELRKEKGLTQAQASELTGIPLRTFKMYENDPAKKGSIKHSYIVNILSEYGRIDETHGILSSETITEVCAEIFKTYPVDYAILFGSYAKGNATETSDVDLLVATKLSGLKYYGLVETLRTKLHKKVDALDLKQLEGNPELLNDILKEGIRIYAEG